VYCEDAHDSAAEQKDVLLKDLAAAQNAYQKFECTGTALLLQCGSGEDVFLTVRGADLGVLHSSVAKAAAGRALKRGATKAKKAVATARAGLSVANASAVVPVAETYPTGAQSKCTVHAEATCRVLEDALSEMVGEVEDALETVNEEFAARAENCAVLNHESTTQENAWLAEGAKSNVDLALGTRHLNEAEEHERLTKTEQVTLYQQEHSLMQHCAESRQALEDNLCGIRSMRLELAEIGSVEPVQDCVVSDWQPGPCSAPCGGGEMDMTRTIVAEPVGGAQCPPLLLKRACNQMDCPQDCEVQDWSGWSECSKDCGGGVRQRVRLVRTPVLNQGEPCPALQEEEVCNVGPCERDCEYGGWSEWSSCSQACGGGYRARTRAIAAAQMGSGMPCAGPESKVRLQPEICNDEPCPEGLTCGSPLDLVVLLDGSGSVIDEDFAAQKAHVAGIIDRLDFGEDLAKVGVAVYGGNTTQIVALSADKAAVETAVAAATTESAETRLAKAFEFAMGMLTLGRQDAQSVVVVMIDGGPADLRAAEEVAAKLHEHARVVMVPIGAGEDLDAVKRLASFPARVNVLAVSDFAASADETELTRFVAGLCPLAEAPSE
jgi:uncharacterized protein YegL